MDPNSGNPGGTAAAAAASYAPPRWAGIAAHVVFLASVAFIVWMAVTLMNRLPGFEPLGGPDEPLHRSLSEHLARELSWPRWDAEDLKRYKSGVSYATGSSFGYWVEGITQRATGRPRLSALLLLGVVLAIFAYYQFRWSPWAGLIGLAALTPQAMFLFSYVNSDAWTVLIALLLGLAMARFVHSPDRTSSIILLFCAAAACISCRHHLWAIGGLAFLYALGWGISAAWRRNAKALGIALALGILVASWWPVTSVIKNDGDPIGFAAGLKSAQKFADPEAPPQNRPWSEFDLLEFAHRTAVSFYAWWGWLTVRLTTPVYLFAALMGAPLLVLLILKSGRWIPLMILLPLLNFGLMILYSVQYDYQPQGRYLYPSLFIIVGILLREIGRGRVIDDARSAAYGRIVPALLVAAVIWNAVAAFTLWRQVDAMLKDPMSYGSNLLIYGGRDDEAWTAFLHAAAANPKDARAVQFLGQLRFRQGNYVEAEMYVRRAINIAPEDPEPRLVLSVILVEKLKFDEAIEQLKKVIELAPQHATAHDVLSDAYELSGDLENAKIHARRALEINPTERKFLDHLRELEQRDREP